MPRAALTSMLLLFAACAAAADPPTTRPTPLPGTSFDGPLPELTAAEAILAKNIEAHVTKLAGDIGERNMARPERLAAAADYIEQTLTALGYAVKAQPFDAQGVAVKNLEAELPGVRTPEQIVLLGAHYDSARGTPGANDNATGVAAVLELARTLKDARPARTVRFVFFTNEEPPFFQTDLMGSVVYAKRCRGRGENIVAMLTPETIGYYDDAPGSQKYPPPLDRFFPSTGNFIAFVGNSQSKPLVHAAVGAFRATTQFPSEGIAAPALVAGVGFSDHGSFWRFGYPALMLTDTAMYRYPHYHRPTDTPDRVDYAKTARVTAGLGRVVEALATPNAP